MFLLCLLLDLVLDLGGDCSVVIDLLVIWCTGYAKLGFLVFGEGLRGQR
jgi:hypothetical protein